MVKQLQLSLEKRVEPTRKTHYLDLSIDQKINTKANTCGFQSVLLNYSLPWNKKLLGFILRTNHTYTHLTETWYWHHKVNDKPMRKINIQKKLF